MTATLILVFPAAMVLAACFDFFTMTIPNRLVVAFAAAFVVVAAAAGMGMEAFAMHLGAGAAMLAVGFTMFCLGWIGGGDAKFFAATALWLGWEYLLGYALLFSILGGGLTIALLMARRLPLPSPLDRAGWATRLHDPRTGVPYGIALAAAGLMIYPKTPWIAQLAG